MALPVNYTYFLDGSYYLIKLNGISVSNRGFKFGDFLFETVRTRASQALLLDKHFERLKRGMELLKMNVGDLPTLPQLHGFIESLINKNRYYTDCRVRITVFRKGEGLYTPDTNDVSILIEAKPLETKGYENNSKGILIGVFDEHFKSISPLSNFKCGGSFVCILAGIYRKESQFGDVLLKNSEGRLIEAISSNLFFVRDDVFYTPRLETGCVDGIMRTKVIELIRLQGWSLQEIDGATEDLLEWADEIFLTNAIVGIQGVIGFKKRRFYLTKSKILNAQLNEWYKTVELGYFKS